MFLFSSLSTPKSKHMTSFYADTLHYISDHRASVCAFLTTSRPIFNSSIIPVTLNSEVLWNTLVGSLAVFLSPILSIFILSDTLQFSPSLFISFSYVDNKDADAVISKAFEHLVNNTRYFSRCLKSVRLADPALIHFLCNKIPSLDSFQMSSDFFSKFKRFTDDDMKMLASGLPSSLQRLVLDGQRYVTAAGFREHLSRFTLLTTLSLSSVRNITDEVVTNTISNLRNLRSLNLSFTDISDLSCTSLTNLAFLTELELTGNAKISDKGIIVLSDPGRCDFAPSLQKLHIDFNSSLTDKSIAAISSGMTALKVLHIEYCRSLTTVVGIEMISTNMSSSLEELYFGECPQMNVTTLKLLANNLSHLRVLGLTDCSNLKAEEYISLSHFRNLELVTVKTFGISITAEVRACLKAALPRLKIKVE